MDYSVQLKKLEHNILPFRRRSITNDKTKKLQDEAKIEKEEPVKEYKVNHKTLKLVLHSDLNEAL